MECVLNSAILLEEFHCKYYDTITTFYERDKMFNIFMLLHLNCVYGNSFAKLQT